LKVGYIRVSTQQQSISRQVKSLKEYGCEKIFIDKKSGKDFEREEYKKMKKFIREKDVVVFAELDRLGRNKKEIDKEWSEFIERGIDIVVLDMPILDTTKYQDDFGKLIMNLARELLSYNAEQERLKILELQRQGIEIAKKEGKFKGRPTKYHAGAKGKDKIVYERIVQLLEEGKSVMDIHLETHVSRNTIYRIRRELNI
jgi:DNA invertase Pin-like site-specific DNA recombinase